MLLFLLNGFLLFFKELGFLFEELKLFLQVRVVALSFFHQLMHVSEL
jgi:hypothetical protein